MHLLVSFEVSIRFECKEEYYSPFRCMFQPCAPLPALMEVPVCAGTSVCVLAAGQEQAATQVHCLWGSEGQVLHQINRVDSV